MELDHAIKGRRSVRRFLERDVSVDMVRQIVEAGTFAPSAKNGQQWRFTVLKGEAKRAFTGFFGAELEKVSRKIGLRNMGSSFSSCRIMEDAPVVIVVWNAGENNWETEIHSVAAAIQNMLLEAYSLGLGSVWIGDIFYSTNAIKRYFNKEWKLTAAVALGWPAENPEPRSRKTVDEVTEFLT